MAPEDRADAIGALTEDALWQGVGGAHGAQFGAHRGPAEIAAHMRKFYAAENPRQIFNTHYLTAEQLIATSADTAEGNWVQFQPWVYDDGSSLIRSSRLHVQFRKTEAGWRIAHYRTENLFIGKLPDNWAQTLIGSSVLMATAYRKTTKGRRWTWVHRLLIVSGSGKYLGAKRDQKRRFNSICHSRPRL
jgi:hypothetical protein